MTVTEAQLRRASRITFAGTVINFAVLAFQLVLVTPLLITTVGVRVNGAWVGSGDILLWLQAFDFGLTNFTIQRMSAAYAAEDLRGVSSWFAVTLVVLLVLALLIVGAGLWVTPVLYQPFGLQAAERMALEQAFMLGLIATGITVVNYSFTGLARALQNPSIITAAVILGSIAGLGVALWGLHHGAGIISVAYGMLTRSVLSMLGGVASTLRFRSQLRLPLLWPRRDHLVDGLKVMPYSGVGAVGYAVSNQSDNIVVGYLFGPTTVTVFNTMRRVADVARSVIETLGYAHFPAFAHRFAAAGAAAAGQPYTRLLQTHMLLSVALCGGFIVFNELFVRLWIGSRFYINDLINTLMAIQVFFVTRSYLLNTLNRTMQDPRFAYLLQAAEAVVKVLLILAVARISGVTGLLVASVAVAVGSILIMSKANAGMLGRFDWNWPVTALVLVLIGTAKTINFSLGMVVYALSLVSAWWWLRRASEAPGKAVVSV